MGFWPSPIEVCHSDTYPAINPTNPNLSAKGKSIFITGGGTGIGPEIARAFALAGSTDICIIGRRENPLLSTKTALENEFPGLTVSPYAADITNREAVEAAFSSFIAKVGKVDVLVANAGYFPDRHPILDEKYTEEYWSGFEINIKGNLNVAQVFQKYASQPPTVVHISAAGAHIAPKLVGKNESGYYVSKLAAARVFEFIQSENPDWNVYIVHPGVIPSPMLAKSEVNDLPYPKDTAQLPAHFTVWLASGEGRFLKGKFVWAAWDVNEMKKREDEITKGDNWTIGLLGWPYMGEGARATEALMESVANHS